MSEQNYMLIGKALNTILRPTLAGLVGQKLSTKFGADWWRRGVLSKLNFTQKKHLPVAGSYEQLTDKLDAQLSLLLIDIYWDEVFADDLPPTFFNYFKELKTIRNLWAHRDETNHFDDRYTARALDTMAFIAEEFDEDTAEKLRELKDAEPEKIFSQPRTSTHELLKPWRDVIVPNADVTAGEYSQSEWAVNLASVVFDKDALPEYTEPVEFFSRTYLTDGLKGLLVQVLRRVTKGNGEPVIQLKTAFGGGKTHSLLALYHLFGGIKPEKSSAVREILEDAKVESLPKVNTAVFVGTWTNPLKSTLWGEIAAQLAHVTGKPELYEMIRENDEKKTSPGVELMKKIFDEAAPCLILIDELVSYGRKLRLGEITDGGTFGNLMSFIQELTEAAKASPRTALVASIPESDKELVDDLGRQVRDQMETFFKRVEYVWRSVSRDEGYEIVRRRLFGQCNEAEREKVCAAFYRMYVDNKNDFPAETRGSDYKNKLLSCYPIHPKLFDFFYEKWMNLDDFQKTRGVLRLMAKIIYNLCLRGDNNSLMIMPCDIPLYAADVNVELTKNLLGENWDAIVDSEIDGEGSKSWNVDVQNNRFRNLQPARKISRSIFMGTAPFQKVGGLRGVTENEIRLCTIQPTEIDNVAVFNDALAKLRTNLYYLYSEGSNYWFGLTPTLRRLVDDKRASYSDDVIFSEIETRLAEWRNKNHGDFKTVHICPKNSADVPDEQTARLVILSPKNSFDAATVARNFLDNRGTVTRQWKNMLLFLAADAEKLGELKDTVRELKAWLEVKKETRRLTLTTLQIDDVDENIKSSTKKFAEKLSQAYCRLLYPVSDDDKNLNLPLEVAQIECTNEENISAASKYFTEQELLLPTLGGNALKRILDEQNFIWQKGDKVNVKQLWEYFAKFYYMPRLVDENVLFGAICNGVKEKTFGLSPDEEISNVEFDAIISRQIPPTSFLVKAEVAQTFVDAKKSVPEPEPVAPEIIEPTIEPPPKDEPAPIEKPKPLPKNFYMSAELDNVRYGRQIKGYVDDVAGILESEYPNAKTTINVTIKVFVPDGVSEEMQEIIAANCNDSCVTACRFT